MAKYGSSSIVIEFDNAGGTLVNVTQYVTTINGIDVEALMEEGTHPFGASWEEAIPSGVRRMNEITLGGLYDDTATTGPDAIFNAVASSPTVATRTLRITWGGTKTTSVECYIKNYRRTPTRNEVTKFEVVLRPVGAVTET
ncbi:MAG TPA: hypothetical protein VNI83_04605 [Vicinamibacterales bacterium]|nr:hypothetical protein [Vicinamibacterales bacterium]